MRVQFPTHLYKDYRKKSKKNIVFNSNCNNALTCRVTEQWSVEILD